MTDYENSLIVAYNLYEGKPDELPSILQEIRKCPSAHEMLDILKPNVRESAENVDE